jgi:hypothetical protein
MKRLLAARTTSNEWLHCLFCFSLCSQQAQRSIGVQDTAAYYDLQAWDIPLIFEMIPFLTMSDRIDMVVSVCMLHAIRILFLSFSFFFCFPFRGVGSSVNRYTTGRNRRVVFMIKFDGDE